MVSKGAIFVFAVVLLLALLVVFFAPAVDLEPTALRAYRVAVLMILAIFFAGHALLGSIQLPLSLCFTEKDGEEQRFSLSTPDPVSDFCSQLC
jgi:hypothetical protein